MKKKYKGLVIGFLLVLVAVCGIYIADKRVNKDVGKVTEKKTPKKRAERKDEKKRDGNEAGDAKIVNEEARKELNTPREELGYVPGEILVLYKKSAEDKIEELAESLEGEVGTVVGIDKKSDAALVEIDKNMTVKEAIEEYKKNPNVLTAEPNYVYTTMDDEPNDEYLSKQWYLDPDNGSDDRGVDAFGAWEVVKNARESKKITDKVRVAVIDTGAELKNPDLEKIINEDLSAEITKPDFDDEDESVSYTALPLKGDGYNSDSTKSQESNGYHGTHVSGIIGAEANNSVGVAGTASLGNNSMLDLMVIDGFEESNSTSTLYLLASLDYAKEKKAKVINMSLGGVYDEEDEDDIEESEIYERKCKSLTDAGITIVCAAGNVGRGVVATDTIYPANFDCTIGVINTTKYGSRSSGSCYGLRNDICAPGTDIYSTKYEGYDYLSGTSMASPIVAGVVAMMYGVNKNITPAKVKQILHETATDIGVPGVDAETCYGLVNAKAAVLKAEEAYEEQQNHPKKSERRKEEGSDEKVPSIAFTKQWISNQIPESVGDITVQLGVRRDTANGPDMEKYEPEFVIKNTIDEEQKMDGENPGTKITKITQSVELMDYFQKGFYDYFVKNGKGNYDIDGNFVKNPDVASLSTDATFTVYEKQALVESASGNYKLLLRDKTSPTDNAEFSDNTKEKWSEWEKKLIISKASYSVKIFTDDDGIIKMIIVHLTSNDDGVENMETAPKINAGTDGDRTFFDENGKSVSGAVFTNKYKVETKNLLISKTVELKNGIPLKDEEEENEFARLTDGKNDKGPGGTSIRMPDGKKAQAYSFKINLPDNAMHNAYVYKMLDVDDDGKVKMLDFRCQDFDAARPGDCGTIDRRLLVRDGDIIEIKNGEAVIIAGVLANTESKASVSEADYAFLAMTTKITKAPSFEGTKETRMTSDFDIKKEIDEETGLDIYPETYEVAYTNTYNPEDTEAGLLMDIMPYIALIATALLLIIGYGIYKIKSGRRLTNE